MAYGLGLCQDQYSVHAVSNTHSVSLLSVRNDILSHKRSKLSSADILLWSDLGFSELVYCTVL